MSCTEARAGEPLSLRVTVRNSGAVDGAEAVQLYVRDEYGSVTRPVLELKGVQKVFLRAGESRELQFEITPAMLSCWSASEKWEVEPGEFTLLTGGSSREESLKKVTLTIL